MRSVTPKNASNDAGRNRHARLRSRSMAKQREPVKCLVFSASLRAGSLNAVLAKLAASAIEQHEGIVEAAAMSAFDSPSYSQDAQAQGFPAGAAELRRRLDANDAL